MEWDFPNYENYLYPVEYCIFKTTLFANTRELIFDTDHFTNTEMWIKRVRIMLHQDNSHLKGFDKLKRIEELKKIKTDCTNAFENTNNIKIKPLLAEIDSQMEILYKSDK